MLNSESGADFLKILGDVRGVGELVEVSGEFLCIHVEDFC